MRKIIFLLLLTIASCGEKDTLSKAEKDTLSRAEADFAAAQKQTLSGEFATDGRDTKKKLADLKQDAASGDIKSQLGLARRYLYGDGVDKDDAKAAEWYEKAAKQGVALAQYQLGMMYQKGVGVPRDAAKAEEWLQKAAAQGLK